MKISYFIVAILNIIAITYFITEHNFSAAILAINCLIWVMIDWIKK